MNIVSSPAIVPRMWGMLLLSMLYAMLLAYPGRVFITAMLPEKFIDLNPDDCIISLAVCWLGTLLYIVSLGRTYTYLPFMLAAFATFSCLRSRLRVACVMV